MQTAEQEAELLDAGSDQPLGGLAVELQELRGVITHAAKVGAVQTTISIELLSVLLAYHDKSNL